MIKYIQSQYPQIKSENTTISGILSDYQNQTAQGDPGSLINYLRRNGVRTSFMLMNLLVSYNGGDYVDLVAKSIKFNLKNRNLNSIGLTVALRKGML